MGGVAFALVALGLRATAVSAQQSAPKAAVAVTDLRKASQTLETLSDRVAPAVVQVFAVGYALPTDSGEERSLLLRESVGAVVQRAPQTVG